MTERKPLHERVKERLAKSQTYEGQKELKAQDARSNLAERIKALQEKDIPTPSKPADNPNPPANQDVAPVAPNTERVSQRNTGSFDRFKELCGDYSAPVGAVTVIIGLLQNHSHERKEFNLLKHLGLDENNLKQLLLAMLNAMPEIELNLNDIRSFVTGKDKTKKILFKKVFGFHQDQRYDDPEMKAKFDNLSKACANFDEFMDFVEKNGTEIIRTLMKISEGEKEGERPSSHQQIEWIEEFKVKEMDLKIYDRNPISAVLNQTQTAPTQPTTPQSGTPPPTTPTTPPDTPPAAVTPEEPAAPAARPDEAGEVAEASEGMAQLNVANEAEIKEAIDYLNNLFVLFQQGAANNELINDLNNFRADASMGTALLASESEPGTVDIKQIIEDQFETTDETEISQIAIELYNTLKDKYRLKSDQQVSLA